jgi:hypothetical protein
MTAREDEIVLVPMPAWAAAEYQRVTGSEWSGQLQIDIKEGVIEQLGFLSRRRKPKGGAVQR